MADRSLAAAPSLPGAYVRRQPLVRTSTESGLNRMVVYVGRGHRYRTLFNEPIVRGFVSDAEITFDGPPYRATLPHRMHPDYVQAVTLSTLTDEPVARNNFEVVDEFDLGGLFVRSYVEINPSVYQAVQYKVSFQSLDFLVLDEIPWNRADAAQVFEMRSIRQLGRSPNSSEYSERTAFNAGDYEISLDIAPVQDVTADPAVLALYNTTDYKSFSVPPLADLNDINLWTLSGVPDAGTYALTVTNDGHARASGAVDVSTVLGALDTTIVNITFDGPTGSPVAVSHTFAGAPVDENDVVTQLNAAAALVDAAYGAVFSLDGSNQLVATSPLAGDARSAVDVGSGTAHAILGIAEVVTNGANIWEVESVFTPSGGPAQAAQTIPVLFDPLVPAILPVTIDSQLSFSVPAANATFDNHVNGTTWTVAVAPAAVIAHHTESEYTAKDSRTIRFEVLSVVSNLGVVDAAQIQYTTDTLEGGFGSLDLATINPLGTNFTRFDLPDGLRFEIANPNNLIAGQVFEAVVTNLHLIDWSNTTPRTELYDPSANEIPVDSIGTITQAPGVRYVRLDEVPVIDATNPLTVINENAVQLLQVTDLSLPGQPIDEGSAILRLATYDPLTDGELTVTYTSRGNEPALGQTYYLTADVLRPLSEYNSVQVHDSPQDAQAFLYPAASDNSLAIMADLAFEQRPQPRRIATIQVYDHNQDGFYDAFDFKIALEAISGFRDRDTTDIVTIGQANALSDVRALAIDANAPLQKRWQLAWVGFPNGTPIGTTALPGSIAETAGVTLQVMGNPDAAGIFVVVANQWIRRTVRLENNQIVSLTLDGSFLAGALAALVTALPSPTSAVMGRQVRGITDMALFSDQEKLDLIDAGAVWAQLQGGVFVWGDTVTTDKSEPTINEISGKVVEQYINYGITRELQSLVGIVGDPTDLEMAIKGTIASYLRRQRSLTILAPWQDSEGNPRDLNPDIDITVDLDADDPRISYFTYWYVVPLLNKRMFGVYSLGGNAFNQ